MKVFAVRTLIAVPFFRVAKSRLYARSLFFSCLAFIGIKASCFFPAKTEAIGYVTELSDDGWFFFY